MVVTGEDQSTQRKPVSVPLFPLQIPHGLGWEQTQASTVKEWQLTA